MARRPRTLRAVPPPLPESALDDDDRAIIQRRVAEHVRRRPWLAVRLFAYRLGGWLVAVGERLQLWAG